MPILVPPELKKIVSFVRRAEELDLDKSNPESRVVAYYCRQYAVQSGIPIATSAEGKKCLGEILAGLEGEKKAMSVFSKDESRHICRRFADKVFEQADDEDRAGIATKETARIYHKSAAFYDILKQFYEEGEKSEEQKEEEQKLRYSKWRAVQIVNAIKEGRKPDPPEGAETESQDSEKEKEYQEEKDDAHIEETEIPFMGTSVPQNESEQGTEVSLPLPAYPPSLGSENAENAETSTSRPPMIFSPPPMPPPPMPPPVPPVQPPPKVKSGIFGLGGGRKESKPNSRLSKAQFDDAMECTKFAIAALKKKDAGAAVEQLKEALKILEN